MDPLPMDGGAVAAEQSRGSSGRAHGADGGAVAVEQSVDPLAGPMGLMEVL